MDRLKHLLRRLVRNPYIDLAVGVILVFSGIWETWETFPQDFANANLKASHGVVIFGIVTVLKAITDMFAGLEFMDEANQAEKEIIRGEKGNKKDNFPLAN